MSDGVIEFDCEGCGYHVFACGIARVPAHGLCDTCAWLCEYMPDPEEMMALRAMLPALDREFHRPFPSGRRHMKGGNDATRP